MTSVYDTWTEREFMQAVTEYAQLKGWHIFHPYDSRRSDPGYPDLTLARNGSALWMELKTMKGKLTAEQGAWLGELGAGAFLFRPSDMPRIREMLE